MAEILQQNCDFDPYDFDAMPVYDMLNDFWPEYAGKWVVWFDSTMVHIDLDLPEEQELLFVLKYE